MAVLTAAQLEYLRDVIGDDTAESYDLTDGALQVIYDDSTQGAGDLGYTIVYALRRRLGKAAKRVALSGEFGNGSYNQLFEQLERLLAYWESKLGMAGGRLTTGILALHLDTTDDDLSADAALGL